MVAAVRSGATLLARKIDLADPAERGEFATDLCAREPDLKLADVQHDLLQHAGELAKPDETERKETIADALVALAKENAKLWSDGDDAYATITAGATDADGGWREHHPIRSKAFRRWLSRKFYLAAEKAPGSQAVQDALNVLEGVAIHDGQRRDVALRVAEHDGRLYLDLCNSRWEAVEIDADGWRVVEQPPVRFRRARSMHPLPIPEPGGILDELRAYVNIPANQWPLVAGWLVQALRPVGPYPVLVFHGEQGSAKSTACRVLRELVDPNKAMVRSEPREPRDLAVAAGNGWVVCLDNLSGLPGWLSDGLCRLSTGGGFSTRELYSDREETIFDAMRPVVLNGIEVCASRSDLLDRCLLVECCYIPEHRRLPEASFWRRFEAARPRLLGALLDVAAGVVRDLPGVWLDRLPRMADFALLGTAAEPYLELPVGGFMASYGENYRGANVEAIEASPVGRALVAMMTTTQWWEGKPSDLLAELAKLAGREADSKFWPKDGSRLGGILRRLTPNLRREGIEVEFGRTGRTRRVTVERIERENSVTGVTSVTTPENSGENRGSGGDAGVTLGDAGDADGDAERHHEPHENPQENVIGDADDAGDAEIPLYSSGVRARGNRGLDDDF